MNDMRFGYKAQGLMQVRKVENFPSSERTHCLHIGVICAHVEEQEILLMLAQ